MNWPKIQSLSTQSILPASTKLSVVCQKSQNTAGTKYRLSQHSSPALQVPHVFGYSRKATWDLWLLRSGSPILPIWIVMQPH